MTTLPKFLVFAAVCISLVFYHFATMDNPRLELLGAGEFRIYSRQDVDSPLVTNRISIATGFIYVTCASNAAELRDKFTQVDGESITLANHMSARDVLSRLGHVLVDQHTSAIMQTTYAHSNRHRASVRNGNYRVNLQIIERGGVTTVGWPVILMGS